MPNKLIAIRLGISEKTVKAHLTNVFRAIGVTDRTQAALWAQRNGLVGADGAWANCPPLRQGHVRGRVSPRATASRCFFVRAVAGAETLPAHRGARPAARGRPRS